MQAITDLAHIAGVLATRIISAMVGKAEYKPEEIE